MRGRLGYRRGASAAAPPILPGLRTAALDVRVLNEPHLVFGDLQRTVDPRIGLGLYGPFDINDPGRRAAIRLGLVGTSESIELVHQFVERSRGRIAPVRRIRWQGDVSIKPMDPAIYPFFPGLEQAFGIEVVLEPGLVQTLGQRELAELEGIEFYEPRVTRLVEVVAERIRVLVEKPAGPDIVIVALSNDVRQLCTGITRHKRMEPRSDSVVVAAQRELAKDERTGQQNLFSVTDMFGVSEEELVEAAQGEEHTVFHDGLKANTVQLSSEQSR